MRLAISGSHATGKSTLLSELRSALPEYTFVDEAYLYLLEEGHGFGITPTIEDCEAQLRRSTALILQTEDSSVVFDRCPIDYLAYLAALKAAPEALRDLLRESEGALRTLDAVIVVLIEPDDRIDVSAEDLPKLRRRVDFVLLEMLIEDSWDLRLRTTQVHGSPADRKNQVLSWMSAHTVSLRGPTASEVPPTGAA